LLWYFEIKMTLDVAFRKVRSFKDAAAEARCFEQNWGLPAHAFEPFPVVLIETFAYLILR
jgi:hypothetical protein